MHPNQIVNVINLFFQVFPMIVTSVVMVTQNGIYSIFGMQLRQNVLKSFQFATSLVYQVTGKYYQIGFLGVYEFYQFIDGFLIVYPAADMYIR